MTMIYKKKSTTSIDSLIALIQAAYLLGIPFAIQGIDGTLGDFAKDDFGPEEVPVVVNPNRHQYYFRILIGEEDGKTHRG